jgi:hypothetical protein
MELKSSEDPIVAVPLDADERPWRDILARSANGTLFHDLDFLRYHPQDRFRFHHLMLLRRGKPMALVPGGLEGSDERPMFTSPLGASIGGFVVGEELSASLAIGMAEALQAYARQQRWSGIRVTLPPSYYHHDTADLISFALFCSGFRLEHRWLSPVLQLTPEPDAFERSYKTRQISPVRAARRKGLRCVETGVEGIAQFVTVFRDTYARHGAAPTHSENEIRDLLTRFPNRVRIHLAMRDDVPVAALLVFHLTKTVANTFYICRNSGHLGDNGPALVIADAMDRLGAAGFRYLDLGPSASDRNFNAGNTFFKEGLGAVGQCRDRWRWDIAPSS